MGDGTENGEDGFNTQGVYRKWKGKGRGWGVRREGNGIGSRDHVEGRVEMEHVYQREWPPLIQS